MELQKTILKIIEKEKSLVALEDAFELIKNLEQTDFAEAHELNAKLRREIAAFLKGEGLAIAELERSFCLQKKSLLFDAPYCFDSYLQYVEWNREPQKKFYLPRRKVLKIIVDDLQDLEDGTLDFLAVSLPPRVGKSTLGIFFLTWLMGKYPSMANLMSGHSDKLTKGFYKEVLQIIGNPEYLWPDVFPGHAIKSNSAEDESIDIDKTRRFPTLTCRSISGTLTGAVEVAKLLYVDDIIEDLEEALNPLRLQNKYDAYLNQLKDRKKDGAKELHIGTRWSTIDVIGKLQEQYEGNPRYRFRVIPALDANEQSNFDFPYGLGFGTKYYLDMRESIDAATWCAKYMGEPYVREGILFPEDELRRYFELPATPDAVIAICDTKDRGADYAFLPVAYQFGSDFYIEDCVCDNGLPEIVEARLAEILVRNDVKMCRFESNSAGGRVAEKIQAMVKKQGGITHITTKYTTANKETKIIINSAWVKEHCVFKDNTVYKKGGDYAKMIKFLGTYTLSGKNKNDDVPDGMAMLAEFAQSLVSNKVEVFKRPF